MRRCVALFSVASMTDSSQPSRRRRLVRSLARIVPRVPFSPRSPRSPRSPHPCIPTTAIARQELAFIERRSPNHYEIKVGFVPNMRVPGIVYVNDQLDGLLFDELKAAVDRGNTGGFLPAVKQIANVAALPGVVSHSVAMPDVHSGYGFCIGNVAAMDMADPEAVRDDDDGDDGDDGDGKTTRSIARSFLQSNNDTA